MRKHVLTIAAAIVVAVLIAVPFAFAQHAHGMRGNMGMPMFLGHLQHVKAELGLTDQQTTDIKAIFKDLRTQNEQYRQSMHGTMKQVAQILLNNPNDIAAAQAVLDQQAATERTMKTNALTAASKALNVLTPEQRTKLGTMIQERTGRMQK
jgi:Spy/CpxP family protein refolding chaperone